MLNNDSVTSEIKKLLEKLRVRASKIGSYVSHNLTEDGSILVSLSNGQILLYSAEIKDANSIPEFRLLDIVARFRPTGK